MVHELSFTNDMEQDQGRNKITPIASASPLIAESANTGRGLLMLAMSSEKLEDCEENLRVIIEDLEKHPLTWKDSDEKRRRFKRKLAEGDALLCDLELEVKKAPSYYQRELSGRISNYRSDLSSLRKEMEKHGLREEFLQQPLLGKDDPFESDRERIQLLKNTDTLNRASASLHRAQKVSAQTDEMATNIMDELGEQKSSLVRTRNRLIDIDVETRRSNRLISSIACKLEMFTKMRNVGATGPTHVQPLKEEKAIEVGAEILGDMFIYGIASSLILYEYWSSRRKAAAQEAEQSRDIDLLENKLKDTEDRLSKIEAILLNFKSEKNLKPKDG